MRKLLVFAAVIIVILVIGSVASRSVRQHTTTNNDAPVFTSVYTLQTTKADDLFVIADTANLTADSHVAADAALVGRTSVAIDGRIDGDLTVMGGNIQLGETARITGEASLIGNIVTLAGRIDGDLSVVADTLNINPGSQLNGTLDICATHFTNEHVGSVTVRQCGEDERAGWQSLRDGSLASKIVSGGGFSVAGFLFMGVVALGLAAFSGLIVTVFPRRFGQMTQAIRTLPRRVSRIGCLTQILIVALIAGLGVLIAVLPPLGLILLPVLALLMLPLGILFVIGWMTMALLAGDWLLRRFARRTSPPMLTVIAGSLGLFLIWTLLSVLPFGPVFSVLMVTLLGAVGFGAAIMTRVGTRSPARSYFVQG